MLASFFIILQNELLLSFRNIGKILANFLFFLISVSVFFLISQNQEDQAYQALFTITIILFSLLSCLIFSSTEFLKKDFEDGTIEQILVSCENFEIFTFAKMIANWMICCLPILIATPLIILISNLNSAIIFDFICLFLLASLTINFICGFCGSLGIAGNSAPMVGIIALPLTIPILLITHLGLTSNNPQDLYLSYKILGGLCILFAAIASIATAKIIKIIVE